MVFVCREMMQYPVSDLSFLPACLQKYIVYMNVGYQTRFHSFIVDDLPSNTITLSLSQTHTRIHTQSRKVKVTLWIKLPSSKVKKYRCCSDLSLEL